MKAVLAVAIGGLLGSVAGWAVLNVVLSAVAGIGAVWLGWKLLEWRS